MGTLGPCLIRRHLSAHDGGYHTFLAHWVLAYFLQCSLVPVDERGGKNNSQKNKFGGLVKQEELDEWTNGLIVIKNKEIGEKLDKCDLMETERIEIHKCG